MKWPRSGLERKEGLQAITRREPDCVILDLMLPDLNGYQVCEKRSGGRNAGFPF